MTIESLPPINQILLSEGTQTLAVRSKPSSTPFAAELALDTDTTMALDHATGLLQSIISDKISEKVIRKMPSDEYLSLLNLLDEIITGSIDKRV
jgi:hypothetical protein